MHKAIPMTMALAAAVCVSGCRKSAAASVDTAKIEQSIRAQEAQWEKDYAAKDANALIGHYADDAAMAGPGDPIATSNADRLKILQALVSDPNLKLSFSADRVQVAAAGDYAISRGHYSITTTDKATKKPATGSGSYLTVYKKQSDGSWKAVEDFITPGPAPASETAAK
jgi:uncharacterized protein (TIGR02246 family)